MPLDIYVPQGQDEPWVIANSPEEASRLLEADAARIFSALTSAKYVSRPMVASAADSFDLYYDEAHGDNDECPLNGGADKCDTCSPVFTRTQLIETVGAGKVVWEYQ